MNSVSLIARMDEPVIAVNEHNNVNEYNNTNEYNNPYGKLLLLGHTFAFTQTPTEEQRKIYDQNVDLLFASLRRNGRSSLPTLIATFDPHRFTVEYPYDAQWEQ